MAETKNWQDDAGEPGRLTEEGPGKSQAEAPRTLGEAKRMLQELDRQKNEVETRNAELVRAMDHVEAALEKYVDLYNHAPVSHLTIDRAGTIRLANLTCSRLLSVARSRLIGARFDRFVVDASRGTFAALLGMIFAGPGKHSCELSLWTGADSLILVRVEAVTSEDQWHLALIDITNSMRVECARRTGRAAVKPLRREETGSSYYLESEDRYERF